MTVVTSVLSVCLLACVLVMMDGLETTAVQVIKV